MVYNPFSGVFVGNDRHAILHGSTGSQSCVGKVDENAVEVPSFLAICYFLPGTGSGSLFVVLVKVNLYIGIAKIFGSERKCGIKSSSVGVFVGKIDC